LNHRPGTSHAAASTTTSVSKNHTNGCLCIGIGFPIFQ
jgi:hypothetical protein